MEGSPLKHLAVIGSLALLLISTAMAQENAGKSADEIARELANPNTPLASLKFKWQSRSFEGDLPGANDQSSTSLVFQPALPFALENGDVIFFRPAILLQLDQPVFDAEDLDFHSKLGLGDTVFDLAYARTTKKGLLMAVGVVSSVPTATDGELGSDRWTLGPEILIGKLSKKSVVGIFPNHQWDIAGSGEAEISVTTVQVFGTYLPSGGWTVGTVPIMSYDHKADQWTIPLNFSLGRTIVIGERPWRSAWS